MCVAAWGLDADRRRGHRSHINKIKTLDLRMRRMRGQNSISIHTLRDRLIRAVAGNAVPAALNTIRVLDSRSRKRAELGNSCERQPNNRKELSSHFLTSEEKRRR